MIEALDADVIGLQEIRDRDALERVFDPDEWHLIIDDESGDDQDVALAVRKPLKVVGLNSSPTDLDADDDDFLYPSNQNNFFFPNRRDVLVVQIEEPESGAKFFVMVHHAKARSGGRGATDNRREGAAREIIDVLEAEYDGKQYILLGDMNDNPDDRSLNILETGDPDFLGGPEQIEGPFMINLTEPLVVLDHVSWGLDASDIQNGQLNTAKPGSRNLNNATRGTSGTISPILFDQILISANLKEEYVDGSVQVFDDPIAVEGTNPNSTASDHLPVSAVFQFNTEGDGGDSDVPVPPAVAKVQIVALLANPPGKDAGNEWVKLKNTSDGDVSIDGWRLRDRAGHEKTLSGSIAAGQEQDISLDAGQLPLNNSGDDVILTDGDGMTVHRVSYTGAQAGSGVTIVFRE